MATYLAYVTFYVSLPALLTETLGTRATKDVVIDEIVKTRRKAMGCPFRLSLRDIATVADDSFCVSEDFSRRHSVGQPIQLVGMETMLGFRFMNLDRSTWR